MKLTRRWRWPPRLTGITRRGRGRSARRPMAMRLPPERGPSPGNSNSQQRVGGDPMARTNVIFVGIKGRALGIDRDTGETLWTTDLKGSDFVNVSLDGGDLFAASKGRLYRLDPTTGEIKWCNELPGLGYGLVAIAGASPGAVAVAEKQRRDAAAAAAAAST